ncbi:MAG: transcriptional regulator [Burkholderiaceae bacterium]
MHPEQIKAAIRMCGSSATEIARSLHVSHACVSHIIHRRGVSAPVAQRIADVTGLPISQLFPEKYPKSV